MEMDLAPILATAREIYGRVVYSHKTHEQEREIWAQKSCTMNRLNIALAALTTLFAVVSATLKPTWALIATALLAAATVAFALYQYGFDPIGKENQHRTAAKELLWIREQLLLLITRCHVNDADRRQLEQMLELITREVTAVYKFAPNTSPQAYQAADGMIKRGHFTFSDDEIDAMLPTDLRKKRP
jgi:SMODS and SLOG-associating 2TM effector domain family 4